LLLSDLRFVGGSVNLISSLVQRDSEPLTFFRLYDFLQASIVQICVAGACGAAHLCVTVVMLMKMWCEVKRYSGEDALRVLPWRFHDCCCHGGGAQTTPVQICIVDVGGVAPTTMAARRRRWWLGFA